MAKDFMTVAELRAFLSSLPAGSDDWEVTLEDSAGGVCGIGETSVDADRQGVWLVGAANGFGGDHW